MAGGFWNKTNSKNKGFKKSEFADENFPSLEKNSILYRNQERPQFTNFLQKEQNLLFSSREQNIQNTIHEIQEEIKKLVLTTEELDKEISDIALEPVTENNEYQLNFLARIKNLIIAFRKNISESCVWLECMNSKKKKKNSFWSKAKNKKSGGEQYLFSGEHSASRSAN